MQHPISRLVFPCRLSLGARLARLLGPPRFAGWHDLACLKVANEGRPVIADRSAEEGVGRALAPLAPIAQRADRFINRGRGLFFSHPVGKEIFVAHAQNFSPTSRREMRQFTAVEKYANKTAFSEFYLRGYQFRMVLAGMLESPSSTLVMVATTPYIDEPKMTRQVFTRSPVM